MRTQIAAVTLAVSGALPLSAAVPLIVTDGQPAAQIVIAAENRPRMATLAALELQYFIQKISGARLPIVTQPAASVPVTIHVGSSPATEKLGVSDKGLKYGAYRTKSGPDWLVLLGDDREFKSPFTPLPKSRSENEVAVKAWRKATAGKTDSAWMFPFGGTHKHYWSPKAFDRVIDERYGQGSSALWTTGGNTLRGFWNFDESGSLNAVCDFLKGLGCRWYMPGQEHELIPRMSSIRLPVTDKTVTPDFAIRAYNWVDFAGFSFDGVLWPRRMGMNTPFAKLGLMGNLGLLYVYGDDAMKTNHPEYYALIGGKRDTHHRGYGTPCLSSEGLAKETIRYVRFLFGEYDLPSVDIQPGDGLKLCQCDSCNGKSASDLVWGFVNRVATAVCNDYPDKLVTCSAYTTYWDPPRSVDAFSPNVAVIIANCERPRMDVPQHWNQYVAALESWSRKVAPGNMMRSENSRHHISGVAEDGKRGEPIPFPVIYPRTVAKDLHFLKGKVFGSRGEQGQMKGAWHAPACDHLHTYVLASFLWNADQNIEDMLQEYHSRFYGPAAREMKAAIDYAEANYARHDTSRLGGRANMKNVPLQTNLTFRDLLDQARRATGDTAYGKRIQLLIDELQPREALIARHEEKQKALREIRSRVPSATGIDGSDLGKAQAYVLKSVDSGSVSNATTTFQVGWQGTSIVFAITCMEPNMKDLAVSSDVFSGDFIALTLQTPLHTHYVLEINPDGVIADGNPDTTWDSLADVKSERGDDHWRLVVTLPVVGAAQAAAEPLRCVAGPKPLPESPWFFNVGRKRTGVLPGGGDELQLFSISEKGAWHAPEYFGKLEIR